MVDAFSDCAENQFFDALEEISVLSDSGLNCPDDCESVSSSSRFDGWIQNLDSVETRKSKFLNWLGSDVIKVSSEISEESRMANFEHQLLSRKSMSCLSGADLSVTTNSASKVHIARGNEDMGGRIESTAGDPNKELVNKSSPSSSPVKNMKKNASLGPTKRVKKWWASRLRSFSCVTEKQEVSCQCNSSPVSRIKRVKVHQSGRQSKELTALYHGQSIQAHRGAILTMKFSPDGRFLASAGEDGVVRVWQVTEEDRSNERDIPVMDPSSVYFTMNQLLELKPLRGSKGKVGRLRRNSESACVVIPPKVFRLLEKPLHEFHGHTSEIVDLSWSRSNYLLSSSIDKTVRLWQVGNNHSLKVFPHNNYVTCVEFNPVDENYFISGSVDGKIRIWEIPLCKVAYWTEIKDIVTAVCYRPDGQGGIIGSITGNCRFYSISDHQFQLGTRISLHNKKSSGKKITGFQYFPRDPSKVMISCADSQVRIVQGVDVVARYKGGRSTAAFSSAHLTSDGKQIVSALEDSSVHIWKCIDHGYRDSPHIKKVSSSERFVSNSSVALPWPGLQDGIRGQQCFVTPAHFSCRQSFLQDSNYPNGSALWPEEKLLAPTKASSMHKSEYKFLRTCQSSRAFHEVPFTSLWRDPLANVAWYVVQFSFRNGSCSMKAYWVDIRVVHRWDGPSGRPAIETGMGNAFFRIGLLNLEPCNVPLVMCSLYRALAPSSISGMGTHGDRSQGTNEL
ncbi:hypothetical protein KSS87_015964 [Heliosperma pusillum]|nr:hypothetical protein KSS87_015964 [Heliosperma pusillum]